MKNTFKWLMILLWMAFIFWMSHQPGDTSGEMSGRIVQLFKYVGLDIYSKSGEIIHTIIRKGAHFFEYFILSLLLFNYFKQFKGKIQYTMPIILSFLYACSDEIHQTFIPSRAGTVTDVIIDTFGAVTAIMFIGLIQSLKNKKLKIMSNNDGIKA